MRVAPTTLTDSLLFCWAEGPNMIKWILERLVDGYISTLYESGFQIQITATRPKLRSQN